MSVLSDEIAKWRILSDYRTMRYLFFLHVRRFCGAAFFHTRAYVYVRICAYAHTCATHAHLLLAREEQSCSRCAFYDSLRNFFHPASSKKQNCGIFGKETVPKLAKSGKKREIRFETAEKRLFAAM